MATPLALEVAALPSALRDKLAANGFQLSRLERWSTRLTDGPSASTNVLPELPRLPTTDDFTQVPTPNSADEATALARGEALLREGRVAMLVLAGGMATRMGGIVKALAEVPGVGSFLDVRLYEVQALRKRYGARVPLWLMTSDATDASLRQALEQRGAEDAHTFAQDLSLRLNDEGQLFRDAHGEASSYATGHGDVVDALRRSGLLDKFLASGGTHIFLTNVDNLGATLDPMMLGVADGIGCPVSVEVCDKEAGDRGGIPVHVNGKLSVLEEFRLPRGFDPSQVRVFNTNTFWLSARALADASFDWPYFEVRKKVDGLDAVQFERLVQELTARLQTSYLHVPRSGTASRFLPVKDNDDLQRRAEAIAAALRSRSLLP